MIWSRQFWLLMPHCCDQCRRVRQKVGHNRKARAGTTRGISRSRQTISKAKWRPYSLEFADVQRIETDSLLGRHCRAASMY